jgi:hypothetical protein
MNSRKALLKLLAREYYIGAEEFLKDMAEQSTTEGELLEVEPGMVFDAVMASAADTLVEDFEEALKEFQDEMLGLS